MKRDERELWIDWGHFDLREVAEFFVGDDDPHGERPDIWRDRDPSQRVTRFLAQE